MTDAPKVAYFSMEISLDPAMPTYAGGLGVLAGDTIRAAADLEVPLIALTLLHRHGYFHQQLDPQGKQWERPALWPIDDYLEPLDSRVTVEIEKREVRVRAWRYRVSGATGFKVPVILLDTYLEENSEYDRTLTDVLYGNDTRYRLCQEVILGVGGVQMLRSLGYNKLDRYHLNEGHASLIILALVEEKLAAEEFKGLSPPDVAHLVREQCVFTTHTPVPSGHDQFPAELAEQVLGERRWNLMGQCGHSGVLNMTELGLRCARFVNGVAMRHGEVSRGMFPGYPIHSITNGVHTVYWAVPSFQKLYDRYLPDWRKDAFSLRYAIKIPGNEIWEAHTEAKQSLIELVNRQANGGFDRDALTIGFARRATAYKRAMLIFHDVERLKEIARRAGSLQIVFAGKAHPRDEEGKGIIRQINEMRERLQEYIPIAYLENYDMVMAKMLCAGADVWLNTPLPPLEASGTSGMKAAVNGVPSLSVLDGWWMEGCIEGVTGWAIGEKVEPDGESRERLDELHASALYEKLERQVLPSFYQSRDRFIEMMRQTIAINGSFFSAQRMLWQYLHNAYRVGICCFEGSKNSCL
ncbi:MAG: alpha-glucan family phosphorylase [Acidobacteriota bacterium]